MILSFSVPPMLPYIRAGIRQATGEDVGSERVKRQTIRSRGPRALQLLEHAKDAGWTHYCDFHLWWKSRTPARQFLGKIPSKRIYPITILHSYSQISGGPKEPCFRITGPRGWREGDAMIFWDQKNGGADFENEARKDGFDNAQEFVNYFVPEMGARFEGVLYRW